jgi:hypothetical protein
LDGGAGISSAQRAQAPLELGACDGVGGERDRALVGAGGGGGVAGAGEQLGVGACSGW